MILTLTREQVHSQARYAAAAFALIALATSLAAFALISLATTQREAGRISTFVVGDTEHHAWLNVWSNGEPVERTGNADPDVVTTAELDSLVSELAENGPAPEVRLASFVWIDGDPIAHMAAAMDSVPPTALKEGTAPGPGQAVVDSALADAHGLAVGDSLGFSPGNGLAPTMTLEVSGILRGANSRTELTPPRIVVDTVEGTHLIEQAGYVSGTTDLGERTALMDVYLSWNGEVPPALVPAQYAALDPQTGPGQKESLAVTALVLVIATSFIAAAAAGRSQGAARTQWVGTVRALGATRRDVVTTAMLETVAVGVGAGMVGVAIGAGVNIAVIRRQGGTFAGDWPILA